MGLISPEKSCCAPTGTTSLAAKLPEQVTPENSSSYPIPQDERIRKLEIQMTRLVEDMEMIKNQQRNAANVIQQTINRGLCGLGDRFRVQNDICTPSYGGGSKNERSSRSSCCSSSSATSSSIRVANFKDNAHTPVEEKDEKAKEDKNGCAKFVLG